jgi:hypothetical protein
MAIRLSELIKRFGGPGAVLVLWSASRRFAWTHGVHFDGGGLTWYWQFLDTAELKNHLLRSLWYFHSQPPLFNLLLGLGLKVSDHPDKEVYGPLFLLLGVGLHLGLYALLRLIGLSTAASVLTAAFFAWSPSSLLYENWLFYSYPAAALLVWAAVGLALGAHSKSTVGWTLFFGSLCTLTLLVAFFHFLLLLLCVAGAWLILPDQRRRIVQLSSPWILLAFSLYLKNLILFGSFSASTWFGMNLARVAEPGVPIGIRTQEVSSGLLSPLALITPASALKDYPGEYGAIPPRTPLVPVLTNVFKSTGADNRNHIGYVRVARTYLHDSLSLIRRHPADYLRTCFRSWLVFMHPPSEYFYLTANRDRIGSYVDWFNVWVYGTRDVRPPPSSPDPFRYSADQLLRAAGRRWALLGLLSVLACFALAFHDLLSSKGDRARGVTVAFLIGVTVYGSLVGNMLEFQENNRFRWPIEPFIVALMALALSQIAMGMIRLGGRLLKHVEGGAGA